MKMEYRPERRLPGALLTGTGSCIGQRMSGWCGPLTKDMIFPGLYDTSSAGHIPAGEEPVPSALRELQEELGIEASADQLQYAGTFRIRYEKEFHGRLFRDNEVTKVYVYSAPVKIDSLVLQKSEVDEVQWFDLNEVWEEIRQTRERFCVPSDGLDVLKRFLESGAKYERRLI